MPKIVNIGAPPTTDANPITNHPAAGLTSTDTHPSDHKKASSGGGGT